MTAVIKYGYPEIGHIYYELPLFDSHPVKLWDSYTLKYFRRTLGIEDDNFYYLSFQPDDYSFMFGAHYFDERGEGLNEYQIKDINTLYFKMLDNPEIIEGTVVL